MLSCAHRCGTQADFTTLWAPVCARRKIPPGEFTAALAAKVQVRATSDAAARARVLAPTTHSAALPAPNVQAELDANPSSTRLLRAVAGTGPYLNLFLNRPVVFRLAMRAVARLGPKFGHTDGAAGKRVIVEHTSSNPNAPLHIGNLRNVMIGAHLARLLAAVGYDVKQAFYVNDLGAQVSNLLRCLDVLLS